MSDIFALQGIAKCGKTPTLHLVLSELTTKYKINPSHIRHLPPTLPGEIKVILPPIKGYTVGIASQGDVGEYFILDQTLDDFENAGCDIIFCACRTSGATLDCINAHKKYTPHFKLQIILSGSHTPHQETRSNTLVAQQMISAAGL